MPKGRRSNERRRSRRLGDRHPRSDVKAQEINERGHIKLVALFEQAQKTQKARRKRAKRAMREASASFS
jgi:hypothetical protein